MKYVFKKNLYILLVCLLDAAGYAFFWVFRRKPTTVPEVQNILLIRLDHLGDVLGVSGAPELLKKKFPKARVTFLTSSLGSSVMQNNPYVDEMIVYDPPWFSRKKGNPEKKEIRFLDLPGLVRGKGFDLALSLRGDLRENFLLWKAGVSRRIGFGITGGGFFLTDEILYRFGVHESEHTADILRALGIHEGPGERAIYFSEQEERMFAEKMLSWGISSAERWVGFQLGAGVEAKNWPEENIRLFFKKFVQNFPREKILLVGSDRDVSGRLMKFIEAEGLGANFLSLVGKTSARELFYVLKRLRAFIGPDSGPAHAAAGMGVPTLFLYSGTNVFEEWRSLSESASFLRHVTPCMPCFRTACNVDGHPCMAQIEPQTVLNWLLEKKEKFGANV